jgi:hypothetical protein
MIRYSRFRQLEAAGIVGLPVTARWGFAPVQRAREQFDVGKFLCQSRHNLQFNPQSRFRVQ